MFDLPPEAADLHVIARWLEHRLATVRAALESAEDQAGPRWWVQWMRRPAGGPREGVLHRRGCWAPGGPELHAEQVREVVERPGVTIEECPVCRAEAP
ncbi:DUF6233 domain-containing protein [Streptomyces sp. SBT349]|uniref:DUF6233 domain-containing protein n=1 Tax=Streptomyces sp. SBT349 TaxID=1580539 RepID=UPI00066A4AA3|nr:DUF6233 domain-containing protein [Streptomyces sp. SBT349]